MILFLKSASDRIEKTFLIEIVVMFRSAVFIVLMCVLQCQSAWAVTAYKCILKHTIQDKSGNSKTDVVNNSARVYDAGNTFTFSPDGSKLVTSPQLTDIIGQNNQPMKAGEDNGLMYIHVQNSFVIATETEGYIYEECVELGK
jgi:hypothetical protein